MNNCRWNSSHHRRKTKISSNCWPLRLPDSTPLYARVSNKLRKWSKKLLTKIEKSSGIWNWAKRMSKCSKIRYSCWNKKQKGQPKKTTSTPPMRVSWARGLRTCREWKRRVSSWGKNLSKPTARKLGIRIWSLIYSLKLQHWNLHSRQTCTNRNSSLLPKHQPN